MLEAVFKKKLNRIELDVNFRIDGGCLGILGPSGCGKSMTMKSVAGIVRPDRGLIRTEQTVFYDSKKKIDMPARRRRVGYLFQNYALFSNMTVAENILTGVMLSPLFRGKDRGEARRKAAQLIEMFHLESTAGQYPGQLSGGQQQRTAFARLLGADPEFLFLDEPFSALDGHLKEELQMELRRQLQKIGKTTALVSHDRDEIYRLCDRTALMDKGKIFDIRPTKELFSAPSTYMGARLTGCKNIVRVGKTDGNRLYIPEWGVWLSAEGVQNRIRSGGTVDYIGVRAHHFIPIDAGEEGQGRTNAFEIRTGEVIEEPFENTVIFSFLPQSSEKPEKSEVWLKCKDGKNITHVWIDPAKILLLSRDRYISE